MARRVGPVRPRIKDERRYFRALKLVVLDPLFQNMRTGLTKATGVAEILRSLEDKAWTPDYRGLPEQEVQLQMVRLAGYHRRRLIQTFRSALGVDIRLKLLDPPIRSFLRNKVSENVDLIKTIPPRSHASLKRLFVRELEIRPFDRNMISKLVGKEYKISGYNLRRITRDQTTKTIGGLTEIRNKQVGVVKYQWLTSEDERVRSTHERNNNRVFEWGSPPADTGHPGNDIQCRCTSRPIVEDSFFDGLTS